MQQQLRPHCHSSPPAGLLHANARTYNPVLGVMHQADPLLHNIGDSQVG